MTDDAMLYEWLRADMEGFFANTWMWLVVAMLIAGAAFLWYKRRSRFGVGLCLFSAFAAGIAAVVKMAGLTMLPPHYLVVWGAAATLLIIGGHQADKRRLEKLCRRRMAVKLQHHRRPRPALN